jgi:hypothetical protein
MGKDYKGSFSMINILPKIQYLKCVDASANFPIMITLGKLYTETSTKHEARMVGIIDDAEDEAEYYAYRFNYINITILDTLKEFK